MAWILAGAALVALIATAALVYDTLRVRYERDVGRMVFNDNTELLSDLRRRAGLETDSLSGLIEGASCTLRDGNQWQEYHRKDANCLQT